MDGMTCELELARKLFWLLAHDQIFLSTYNEEKEDWDGGAYPAILCNDIFVPGADAEQLKEEDLDAYIETVKRWPSAGSAAWCAVKRSAKPWRDMATGPFKDEYEEAVKGIPEILKQQPAPTVRYWYA